MTTYQLSAYEQARLDKIQRNEERLKSLGLLEAKKRVRKAARQTKHKQQNTSKRTRTTTTRSKKRGIEQHQQPTRTSRRLKHKPVQYEPLMDDDESLRLVRKKFKEVKKQTNKSRTTSSSSSFKCDIPPGALTSPLNEKEKKVIEEKMEGDFLGKFEEYLSEVDSLSDQNKRNVMRQVTKLVHGEGIRYESKAYGWPEGCYFLKGTKVNPTDDILKLMDIGRECEEEWGRDHGNGWLLSHPLKKMYQFQQYHLQD